MLGIVRFASILLTGLALIAPGAHLFELPNKITLAKEPYFVVQQIYSGWWIVGLLLPLALLANLAHAVLARTNGSTLWLSLGAAGCIALNLTVFVLFTQPANAATSNWLVQPENWEMLRRQWEYSHAINAAITCGGFMLAIAAGLRSARAFG